MKNIRKIIAAAILVSTAQIMAQAPTVSWVKSYGSSSADWAKEATKCEDGGYFITCYSTGNDGDITGHKDTTDIVLIKTDALGNKLWVKNYGGDGVDFPENITSMPDSGAVICGYTSSTNGDVSKNYGHHDAWIFRVDKNGTIMWEKSLGTHEDDRG